MSSSGREAIVAKERMVPLSLRRKLKETLQKLETDGTIEACEHADWVSPIVVVRKLTGAIRLCGDFRELNANLVNDKYPLPRIDDLLAEIGPQTKWFYRFDLEAAYHQIPLEEDSQPLTTIVTPFGTYKYKVMPFGIKTAPPAFQRIIEKIVRNSERTMAYLDDILVVANTREELVERTRKVRNQIEWWG